jgi:hypothetical protein
MIDRLREQETLDNAVKSCELQWKRHLENLKLAEQAMIKTQGIWQQLQNEWQGWLKERGFDVKTRPEGFETIIQIIEKGRTAERSLTEDQRRLTDMEQYISGARSRIISVLDLCGEEQTAREPGIEDIGKLKRSLETAQAAQIIKVDLKDKIENARSEIESGSQKMNGLQAEIDALFHKLDCQNEDEFRGKWADFIEWQKYHEQSEEDNRALLLITGTREAQSVLQKELAATEVLCFKRRKNS